MESSCAGARRSSSRAWATAGLRGASRIPPGRTGGGHRLPRVLLRLTEGDVLFDGNRGSLANGAKGWRAEGSSCSGASPDPVPASPVRDGQSGFANQRRIPPGAGPPVTQVRAHQSPVCWARILSCQSRGAPTGFEPGQSLLWECSESQPPGGGWTSTSSIEACPSRTGLLLMLMSTKLCADAWHVRGLHRRRVPDGEARGRSFFVEEPNLLPRRRARSAPRRPLRASLPSSMREVSGRRSN